MSNEGLSSSPAASVSPDAPAQTRGNTRSAGRRVIILLALIWVLNGFDLAFTIMSNNDGYFNEANPIAASLLDHPYAIYVFKLGLVTFASLILFSFRDRKIVELSTWLLLAVYVGLFFAWLHYFRGLPKQM